MPMLSNHFIPGIYVIEHENADDYDVAVIKQPIVCKHELGFCYSLHIRTPQDEGFLTPQQWIETTTVPLCQLFRAFAHAVDEGRRRGTVIGNLRCVEMIKRVYTTMVAHNTIYDEGGFNIYVDEQTYALHCDLSFREPRKAATLTVRMTS